MLHHRFQRTTDGAANLLVLLVLQRLDVNIHDSDAIGDQLRGAAGAVLSFHARIKLGVVMKLEQQTFAQIAGCHADGIHEVDKIQCFLQ